MKLRKMILTALFIALSFIGANIKIAGSIAFDSMPAFLGALILGPVYGAVIGGLGHFLTAFTSGFYLSLPVHIIIMIAMAVTVYVFGITYRILLKKSITGAVIVSSIAAVIINGPVTIIMVMPIVGKGIIAMLPILSLAALLNVAIAHICYKLSLKGVKRWMLEK